MRCRENFCTPKQGASGGETPTVAFAPRRRASMSNERTCGECEACCTTLAQLDLGKNENEACPHLASIVNLNGPVPLFPNGGCSIFETRPETCKGYVCLWLVDPLNRMKEKDRPDRCGVIFTPTNPAARLGQEGRGPAVVAHECFQGAFDTYDGDRVLKVVKKHNLVALVRYGQGPNTSPKLVGPERLLQLAQRKGFTNQA